tara:strand:+ start:12171 stop:12857 length:687 start_codon:yes stop_codon:yes gene_type:complete
MESFRFRVSNPINRINFDGVDYTAQLGSDISDDTDIVMGEHVTPDDQVEILEKALEQTREDAFQAGYSEGRESALIDMNSRLKELSLDFNHLAAGLKEHYNKLINSQEKTLLSLSLRIAEKILQVELNHRAEITDYLSKTLKKILLEMMDQKQIVIYLNPEWLSELDPDEFIKQINLPLYDKIQFKKDKKLNLGECRVESEDLFVDGSIQHQLKLMEDHLNKEFVKWS